MLIEFTVGNYRSFFEPMTLSLEATKLRANERTLDEQNVFQIGDVSLLRSAAIYGANASGKSNLIRALSFMRRFVLQSAKDSQIGEPTGVERFRLNMAARQEPASFQIIFVLDGVRYRYGFEVDEKAIRAEWLYHTAKREARLFMRQGDQYDIAGGFKEGRGLEARTRPNALFLSVVAQFNGPLATRLLAWFRAVMALGPGLDEDWFNAYTADLCRKDAAFCQKVIDLIRTADLGIVGLEVEQKTISEATTTAGIAAGVPQELHGLVAQFAEQFATAAAHWTGEDLPADALMVPLTQTFHNVFDRDHNLAGQETFLLEQQESHGTRKIFALAGFVLKALEEGTVLVIDELESRLHPLLTLELIRLFNSPQTNPHNAQLVFATHDTGLLGQSLLRRDQIWFTEKDKYGATDLYSLAELNVRNDAAFDKQYINGRYGAIPFIGGLRSLFEELAHGAEA